MLPVLLSLGARLLTIALEPHLRAEGLTGLHQVEQHWHHLPRHGAHRADLGPAVPGEERLVLAPGGPSLLTKAARQEEELAPERRTPALGLPEPPAHGDAALLPRQVHPGELQDLTRRDVVV